MFRRRHVFAQEPVALQAVQYFFRFPERVLEKAVERMLPKESPLARKQMTHLRLFAGAAHDHEAQQPETIDFKSMSAKNTRSA